MKPKTAHFRAQGSKYIVCKKMDNKIQKGLEVFSLWYCILSKNLIYLIYYTYIHIKHWLWYKLESFSWICIPNKSSISIVGPLVRELREPFVLANFCSRIHETWSTMTQDVSWEPFLRWSRDAGDLRRGNCWTVVRLK